MRFDYFAYAYKPNVLQFNKLILILTEQIIMYRITHTESDVELFSMATVATIEVRQDYSVSTIFTFMYCAYVLIWLKIKF